MIRVRSGIGLILVCLVAVFALSGRVSADFGYGDVYWLDETTGEWIRDVDGDWATIEKNGDGPTFSANAGGSTSIRGSAIVDFQNPTFGSLTGFRSFSTLGTTNCYTWENDSENPVFSITATALPFDNPSLIDMVWDGNTDAFYLAHKNTVATWEFRYKVTNNSDVAMESVEVTDNFNGELVIVEDSYRVSGVMVPNVPEPKFVKKGGNGGSYELSWGSNKFSIAPGGSVELTFLVVTGMNPGGHQQYNECGTYFMNSGGVLKYKPDGKDKISLGGGRYWRFKVRVCCEPPVDPPTFCLEVSSGRVDWYIRKPGNYFAKVLDATVSVTRTTTIGEHVAVTFSGFGNLILHNSDQEIPVWYSLTNVQEDPGEWISPDDLNGRTELLYPSDGNDASFSMWQRVDLGTQSPGMYENVGVITFTLVNSQTVLCD